jgi:hypothetical protein
MGAGGQCHNSPAALPPVRRADLDECGKSLLHWDSIPGVSSPYTVATLTPLFRPIGVSKDQTLSKYKNLLANTVFISDILPPYLSLQQYL